MNLVTFVFLRKTSLKLWAQGTGRIPGGGEGMGVGSAVPNMNQVGSQSRYITILSWCEGDGGTGCQWRIGGEGVEGGV